MRPYAVIRKSSLLAGRTTRNNTVSPDLSTLFIACNWTWRQQTSDFARLYSQNNAHRPSTEPQIQCDPPIKPLGGSPRGNGDCSTRTEKHDNTYSIPNFGPNIPRGGGGGGGSLTSSPLMDAALTTFVGVGLCESRLVVISGPLSALRELVWHVLDSCRVVEVRLSPCVEDDQASFSPWIPCSGNWPCC